jgi:two-component system response regulator YesN
MNKTDIRLLIAEDEERVRESVRAFIRKNAPYIADIYCAENGQQALDMIFRYKPHIMLLDIKMPVKSGVAVMREAAAAGALPKTIIISVYDEFEYAQMALRYGAVDYLLKPCRSTDILCAVENAVKCVLGEVSGQPKVTREETGNSFVDNALDYMNRHYPDELTLTIVAEHIGISPNYLSTLFKKALGCGFIDCLNRIRVERACDYFSDYKMKTYEVAYKVGYSDEKYFSSVFKKVKGKNPSEYRKQLRGDAHGTDTFHDDVSKKPKD